MKLGFIGLGRMGKEMVVHMLEEGIDVVVYNRSSEKIDDLISNLKSQILKPKLKTKTLGKLVPSYSIKELVGNLQRPRIIWLMVEHGRPVDDVIEQLLSAGVCKNDIIIDGGNSFYKDSIRRFQSLKKKGIHFLDIGTSGGLEGARNGACIMVGGEEEVFNQLKPILDRISIPGGVAYFGPAGAGHFVKMTHNGVEYGMLQSIGEGFEILEKGPFKLDLHKVADNWNHGSVVRGWLMELLEKALRGENLNIQHLTLNIKRKTDWLKEYKGSVGGGSTGEWTVVTAKELNADIPVIDASLTARKGSKKKPTFAGKIISALRYQFGGHKD